MDKKTLVDNDIENGKKLLMKLDADSIPVNAAFWLLQSDSSQWKLVIASSIYDEKGPNVAYQKVLTALNFTDIKIDLTNMSVVSSKDQLVTLLRTAISTPPSAIEGIRFSQNVINGIYMEDAYIYRLS